MPARGFEDAGNSGKSAPAGMSQWGDAVAVRQVDLGAGIDQQAHDVSMRMPTVPEDHGLQQSGPAQLVDVILVDRGGEQDSHALYMPMMRRGDERGAAIAVNALEIGAGRERHLQDLVAAFSAGVEESAVL